MILTVVSGRGVDDLSSRLPVDAVFAGNHGLEIRGRGLRFEHTGAKQLRPQLAAACAVLREVVRGWPGAWVEDKRLSATVHYRNAEPRGHHRLLVAVRRALAQFGSALALRCGKQAVEIRPRVDWDRHAAMAWIQEQAGPFDKCLWVGEDWADDSPAFSAVRVPESDPVSVALLLAGILRSSAGRGLVAAG